MFENYQAPKELIPSDPRFGCGPSLIPVEYLHKLATTGVHLMGTSHRKSPVKNLVKEVQEGLKTYFGVPKDYCVVLGNGGATLLFDMIGLGVVEKSSLHFTCGEFSEKWYKAHKLIPWIKATQNCVAPGEGINPQMTQGHDMICGTLNETSTGVMLSKLPTVSGETLLAIDATSGAGQVPCDLSKVDLFFFSPQKVFASEGGLFIAIMSPKARARALKIAEDKSRYVPDIMNWAQAIDNSDKNQTYNTPALATLFFLREQVARMNQIGRKAVEADGNKKAELIYKWAEERPYLNPYVKEAQYRSNVVATIDVDDKVDTMALIALWEKQKIVYGIDAYRKLGRNQFRISMFHNIRFEDLERLTKLIDHAVKTVL